jgi:hypothetical protein
VSTLQLPIPSSARVHGPWAREVALSIPGRLNAVQQGLFVTIVVSLLVTLPLAGTLMGHSGVTVTPAPTVAAQVRLASVEQPSPDVAAEAVAASELLAADAARRAEFDAWYFALDADTRAKFHYLFFDDQVRADWDAMVAGTAVAASAAAAATPRTNPGSSTVVAVAGGSVWDALATCESSGNWAMNNGNGFYGGIQFMHSTWVAMGGRDFAEYPHQASRDEQIVIAERLLARSGWGQWPACSARLGLR